MENLDLRPLSPRPWRTWIFDCDGVLLNTNFLKAEAMQEAASLWGEEPARALLVYHRLHGGIGRKIKFRHFFENILGQNDYGRDLEHLMERYGALVRQRALKAEEATGLRPLLEAIRRRDIPTFVVSGAEQDECREILQARGLARHFQNIFGAPDSKADILAREIAAGNMPAPRLFLGDARYDHEVATANGCDFVFLSGWTEFEDWEDYFADKSILACVKGLAEISNLPVEEG